MLRIPEKPSVDSAQLLYEQAKQRAENLRVSAQYNSKLADNIDEKDQESLIGELMNEEEFLKLSRRKRKGGVRGLLRLLAFTLTNIIDAKRHEAGASELALVAQTQGIVAKGRIIQEVLRRNHAQHDHHQQHGHHTTGKHDLHLTQQSTKATEAAREAHERRDQQQQREAAKGDAAIKNTATDALAARADLAAMKQLYSAKTAVMAAALEAGLNGTQQAAAQQAALNGKTQTAQSAQAGQAGDMAAAAKLAAANSATTNAGLTANAALVNKLAGANNLQANAAATTDAKPSAAALSNKETISENRVARDNAQAAFAAKQENRSYGAGMGAGDNRGFGGGDRWAQNQGAQGGNISGVNGAPNGVANNGAPVQGQSNVAQSVPASDTTNTLAKLETNGKNTPSAVNAVTTDNTGSIEKLANNSNQKQQLQIPDDKIKTTGINVNAPASDTTNTLAKLDTNGKSTPPTGNVAATDSAGSLKKPESNIKPSPSSGNAPASDTTNALAKLDTNGKSIPPNGNTAATDTAGSIDKLANNSNQKQQLQIPDDKIKTAAIDIQKALNGNGGLKSTDSSFKMPPAAGMQSQSGLAIS